MSVLVLGAGPVGQTAALALARWGIPAVVLDQRPGRDLVGSKAICQQRDVLDLWSELGARAIAEEGLTWSRARTFYRDRELFVVELRDPGRSPFPPFVNISQARTEQVLDEAIAAQPLIDVRWSHRVTGISQSSTSVTVRCETPDGEVELAGDYAVACAGARATDIRAMLGVDFGGTSFTDAFLICDIEATLPGWEQERRFYFDPSWNPGRQVLIHPCPHGLYRIDWQVEPDFDLDVERSSGRLHRRIRQIIGDSPYRLEWSTVYHFHARIASRFRVGRVLLAGDLAHLVAPFGARGLNSGVPDVENAAWKIAWTMRGWAGPGLLDSYETERRAAAVENLEVTTATMAFLVPHSPGERARRVEVLRAAGHDATARAQVDSGRLSEPFWYVDSPLTTTAHDRRWPGRPPRGAPPEPVPGVILPDAPVALAGQPGITHVRQLARAGLLALAGPGANLAAFRAALSEGAGTAPHAVLALAETEPSGILLDSLKADPADVWLVRPDAHTCAVVREPGELATAARRALGHPG
ncbi:FAD-dependent monooxygenase [Intrasporangium sp.]|jgi:pentachlorophenol monooxygenase/3-(3-hydroxy-phenyl)propionate hydroxylase|uniref:FAD-dependent monooxygenase n=1 Tax=Intrasporangium sp. TaxID=1925024 RepID=UPI0033657261